jgi:hypothetical protein
MTEKGIIYLLQPVELKETNRYKIGYSGNADLSRIKSYKKGSRYICIMECKNPLKLEKEIIKAFNEEFKVCAGKEYFEGNEQKMLLKFLELTTKQILESENMTEEQIKQENERIKEADEESFKEEIYEHLIIVYERKIAEDKKIGVSIREIISNCCKSFHECSDYKNIFKISYTDQQKIVENILLNDDMFKNKIEIIK